MNIIKHRKAFLTFSSLVILVAIASLVVFGLRPGIDFTGGSIWQIKFSENSVAKADLADFLKDGLLLDQVSITEPSTGGFLIRSREMSELEHQDFLRRVGDNFGPTDELRFGSIGATIGKELSNKAIWAFIINLLAISAYIAYAFRKVSYPVSSWKYAATTLLTLFHDALIPVGLFALLGKFAGIEVDTNFIVAMLVVVGFSVHDTIVVFDRIRENLRHSSVNKEGFATLVNRSINETIARSVNTSLTLIVVLVALYLIGASTLNLFILAVLVGTIAGTYSSIFVASPLLVVWHGKSK